MGDSNPHARRAEHRTSSGLGLCLNASCGLANEYAVRMLKVVVEAGKSEKCFVWVVFNIVVGITQPDPWHMPHFIERAQDERDN